VSGALSALQFVSGRYPLVNLQKTMLSIGKSTISMVIFHNYVKLPKGNNTGFSTSPWCRSTSGTMSLEVMPSCRIYGRWNFEMRDPRNRTSSEFPKWKERHVSNPGPWLEPRAWNHDILPVNWTYRKSAIFWVWTSWETTLNMAEHILFHIFPMNLFPMFWRFFKQPISCKSTHF